MKLIYGVNDGKQALCNKKFFLYGNGAHTRVVYGFVHKMKNFCGFVTEDEFVADRPNIDNYPVVPMSQLRTSFPPEDYVAVVAIGFRDFNSLRRTRSETFKDLGYRLASLIDRSVRTPRNFSVGCNSIIFDHVTIEEGAKIGEGVFVGSSARIGHDVILENYNWIGSGTALAGGVNVGQSCIIGLNCSVKQNVTLGAQTLVFPNTFVNMNTKPFEAVSVPAGKVMKHDSRIFIKLEYKKS